LASFTHVIGASAEELFPVHKATFDSERLLQSINSTKETDLYNLTCPSRGDEDDDTATTILKRRATPLQSFSKGKLALTAIEFMRPREEHFYMDVLNNLIMATCDVKNNATIDRCVEINYVEAAKDSNGTCILASIPPVRKDTVKDTQTAIGNLLFQDNLDKHGSYQKNIL